MASATIGPTEFCNGNGRILILISLSQSQKRQHSKRPPQHQETNTSWSQEVREWKIWGPGQSLPGNQSLWSHGVKECKIWGHGQQHSQLLHVQLPPQVHSALGNQLWRKASKHRPANCQLWWSQWQQQADDEPSSPDAAEAPVSPLRAAPAPGTPPPPQCGGGPPP